MRDRKRRLLRKRGSHPTSPEVSGVLKKKLVAKTNRLVKPVDLSAIGNAKDANELRARIRSNQAVVDLLVRALSTK